MIDIYVGELVGWRMDRGESSFEEYHTMASGETSMIIPILGTSPGVLHSLRAFEVWALGTKAAPGHERGGLADNLVADEPVELEKYSRLRAQGFEELGNQFRILEQFIEQPKDVNMWLGKLGGND